MAAKAKKVEVTFDEPVEKKSVVRWNGSDDEEVLTNVYVGKPAMKKLGNPSKIKVTIEAA